MGSAAGWYHYRGSLCNVHPPRPLGTPTAHSLSQIRGPLFSAERQSAPTYIIFTNLSKVICLISAETRPQAYQTRRGYSLPIPGRKTQPMPTMASPENVGSGEADGLLRRTTGETFSRTYSIVKPIHSLLNQNNACALERGNNIIHRVFKVKVWFGTEPLRGTLSKFLLTSYHRV